MKRILIPTDFSDNSWNAIDYAMKMYADEGCIFHLLNTFTPAVPSTRFLAPKTSNERLEDAMEKSSKKRLQATVNSIKSAYRNENHEFKIISSFKLLADEVMDVVEGCGIDIVITGTKGASGMQEVYLGSNTVNIIKQVNSSPVMAIPYQYHFKKLKRIAFATDFNRCFSDLELEPLINLAKLKNATVQIVYVQDKLSPLNNWQRFNFNTLRNLFDPVDHYFQTISEIESVSNTLDLFTRQEDVQLLAMLNYHHSYLEKMTREPVVKRTAFHAEIPLLVLPEMDLAAMAFDGSRERLSER